MTLTEEQKAEILEWSEDYAEEVDVDEVVNDQGLDRLLAQFAIGAIERIGEPAHV